MIDILKTVKKYVLTNLEYIIFFILLFWLSILLINRTWENFINEMLGINSLDAIIYINLENRQDRKELLLKELEKLNVNMSKVHKVSGVFIPKNGHKGCIQSHILALNMIKLNGWSRCLILEDDAELLMSPDTINKLISATLSILDTKYPNWNVIMLATANKILDTNFKPEKIYTSEDNQDIFLEKISRATTSSAYIVKIEYVDKILELFNTCNQNMKPNALSGENYEFWALDQKWATLQEKDNWYSLSHEPIKQREIWSTTLTESHY